VEDLLFNGLERRECTNDAQQLAEISQICVRESRKRFSRHSSESGCGKKRGKRTNGTRGKEKKVKKVEKRKDNYSTGMLFFSFSASFFLILTLRIPFL